MSEHDEQASLFTWFRYYHKFKDLRKNFFSIPNGFWLDKMPQNQRIRYVNYLKKEGYLPGVPDTFFACARSGFNGLFIEMKDKIKKQNPKKSDIPKTSKHQVEIGANLNKEGYLSLTCYGFIEAKYAIILYFDNYFKDLDHKAIKQSNSLIEFRNLDNYEKKKNLFSDENIQKELKK